MTLLITGGGGFVMSGLARRWLEEDARRRVVILDAAPADTALQAFFAPVSDRIELIHGDVLDRGLLKRLAAEHGFSEIVHGAAVTSINRLAHADPERPGLSGIRPALEVNIMGTLNLLEVAAALPRLRRFIYVSSGAVYAAAGPPGAAMPEEGYVDADGYYDVSKYASELLTAVTAQRFGLSSLSVRFSGVYGPMDRETPARDVKCAPYQLVHRGLAGEDVRVAALDAVGDFIHAFDVADAIICLLQAEAPRHRVYNIAFGACVGLCDMADILRARLPQLSLVEVPGAQADIDMDPAQREGRYGAYDISRLAEEFGWRPRPLREALLHYLDWVREHGT